MELVVAQSVRGAVVPPEKMGDLISRLAGTESDRKRVMSGLEGKAPVSLSLAAPYEGVGALVGYARTEDRYWFLVPATEAVGNEAADAIEGQVANAFGECRGLQLNYHLLGEGGELSVPWTGFLEALMGAGLRVEIEDPWEMCYGMGAYRRSLAAMYGSAVRIGIDLCVDAFVQTEATDETAPLSIWYSRLYDEIRLSGPSHTTVGFELHVMRHESVGFPFIMSAENHKSLATLESSLSRLRARRSQPDYRSRKKVGSWRWK